MIINLRINVNLPYYILMHTNATRSASLTINLLPR